MSGVGATATTAATATRTAMAPLAGLTCRGLRCRRSQIRCTAPPWRQPAGGPGGHQRSQRLGHLLQRDRLGQTLVEQPLGGVPDER
jgi:hypothetical protein